MSKTKLLIACVIALVILNLGLMGVFMMQGGQKPPKHMGHKGHRAPMIHDVLNFDDEQNQQFLQFVDKHQAAIHTIDEKILILKKELYQYLNEDNSVKKDSLINLLAQLQIEVELTHFDHFLDIKSLCREDQLENYNKLVVDLAGYFSKNKKDRPPSHKKPRH